jgi:Tfp pilus tip-associated adhesin PilY1
MQVALCRNTASITRLKIMRYGVVRVPELQSSFPDQVTVTSPARARAVARALCALPSMPGGVFSCPDEVVGTTYLLTFAAGGRELSAVTIEATGCEVVSGVGPARWAATSPGFWRVLATSAGLSPRGWSVFSGDSHQGPSCDSSRPEQASDCPAVLAPSGVGAP